MGISAITLARAASIASRYLLAAALSVTAVLKIASMLEPASSSVAGGADAVAACVEIALAIALVARRWRWPVVAAAGLLGLVTGYLVLTALGQGGTIPCGCLGKIRLQFWQHLTLNGVLLSLAGLAMFSPPPREGTR